MTRTFTLPCDGSPAAEPAAPATLTCADGHHLPLRAMRLDAQVDPANAVALRVEQTFANDRSEPVEVTYTFPLPARFAVTAMTATLAGRTVTAELAERQAARDAYDHAVSSGLRAALAENDRDEVFTLTLGNVAAGEEVCCRLDLVGVAAVDDGTATLRLPMVVAERFTPGAALDGAPAGTGIAADTDAAPDASRVTPPRAAGPLGVAVSATVELPDAAAAAVSATHSTATAEVLGEGRTRVTLAVDEPDCDVVLRWPAAPVATVATLSEDNASGDGTEILTVCATPAADPDAPRRPLDVVVLLDRSGSMQGWKMVAARRAAARIADACGAEDRLAVWAFDTTVEHAPGHAHLAAATDAHRFAATSWLGGLGARGGTQLAPALAAATDLLGTPAGRDAVLVVVTDAQVSDEDRCVRSVSRSARVVVVGVDAAANGGLCDRLARVSGGWSETVESAERLDEVLSRLQRAVAAPAWPAPQLAVQGADVVEQAPAVIPDGYPGSPLTVRARVRRTGGPLSASLVCDGVTVAVADVEEDRGAAAAPLFARALLADLEDSYAAGRDVATGDAVDLDSLAARLVEVSLAYGVLCRHTAFVAVDPAAESVSDGAPLPVTQPAAQPRGWDAKSMLRGSVASSAGQSFTAGAALPLDLGVSHATSAGVDVGWSIGVTPSVGISQSTSTPDETQQALNSTSAPHLTVPETSVPLNTTNWFPFDFPGLTPVSEEPAAEELPDDEDGLVRRAERVAKRAAALLGAGRPDRDELVALAGRASQLHVALTAAGDPAPGVRTALEGLATQLAAAAAALDAGAAVAVHLERAADRATALQRACDRHRGTARRGQFWKA